MRQLIFIVFCSLSLLAFGQEKIKLQNISLLESSDAEYKVILISAPWCGICKSNKKLLEHSDKLAKEGNSRFAFYEILEDEESPLTFNGKTYYYEQYGLSNGQHQFIDYLFNGQAPTYPSFVIFDRNNVALASYSGFVNESSWSEIFGTILNHRALPDSESNN